MWVFGCGSHRVQKDKDFENWHFEPFKNCIFLHFVSQWLARQLWAYLWNLQLHRANFSESSLSREELTRDSWNSLPEIFKKLKFLKNFATRGHSWKQLRKGQKQNFLTLKIWHQAIKDQSDKNHFQKHMKHSKIFLGLIIKQLSIHKSHLNTYNHTNEIDIHWTLDLCVVCGNQVWTSP